MPRHNTLFCSDCFEGIRSEQTLDEFADLIGSEHMTVEEILYDD